MKKILFHKLISRPNTFSFAVSVIASDTYRSVTFSLYSICSSRAFLRTEKFYISRIEQRRKIESFPACGSQPVDEADGKFSRFSVTSISLCWQYEIVRIVSQEIAGENSSLVFPASFVFSIFCTRMKISSHVQEYSSRFVIFRFIEETRMLHWEEKDIREHQDARELA